MTYLELGMDPVSGRFSQFPSFSLERSPGRCINVNFKFFSKSVDVRFVYFIANRRKQCCVFVIIIELMCLY